MVFEAMFARGIVIKPEALSKVFLQAACDLISFEEPAVGLRWVLACLLLGLCMSVGGKVGVLKLCSCGALSRVHAREAASVGCPESPNVEFRFGTVGCVLKLLVLA